MNWISKLLLSGSIIAGGSGTAYWTYKNVFPKTTQEWINWKEIKVASEEEDYNALFIENKDSISELGVSNLNSSTTDDEGGKQLKTWCEAMYEKKYENIEEWEQVLKFCQKRFKKVKSYFVKNKKNNFITTDDDYKISLFFLKNSNSLNLVKGTSSSEPDHSALKKWCEAELNKDFSRKQMDTYSVINTFCIVPKYKTIQDLIKHNNKTWEIENDESKWQSRFTTWKDTPKVIELLKDKETETTEKDKIKSDMEASQGGAKLKAWCQDGVNKKLFEKDKDFRDHINSVCKKGDS